MAGLEDGGWDFIFMVYILTTPQVQGIGLTLYVYQLRKDEKGVESVNVEKITYTKNLAASGSASR